MKINHLIFTAFLFAFLTACGRKQVDIKTSEVINIAKVKIDTVRISKESYRLHYSGTIEPSQTIALVFKSTGTVEEVFVDEGDRVTKGQALAIIDKTTGQNLYNISQASYQQAKDAYDRLKSVYENGSLTEIKWVEIETKLKQAESQMQITRSNLEDCTLRAPDDGMIGRRNVEPGQSSLGINSPFDLVKINKILVKISVPENEINKIHKGMRATFFISALNNESFEGFVTKVGIVADKISRTYEVKITTNNPDQKIKPGMVCDVTLNIGTKTASIVVPYKAVSKDSEGNTYVYLVLSDNKKVQKQNIKIGQYHNKGIEVINGLSEGQIIVSEGCEKLSDNSLISL